MTQSNIGGTMRFGEAIARSRFSSVGAVVLLLMLLASIGATGTSTQNTRRKPARVSSDCPPPGGHPLTITFYGLFYFSFPKDSTGIRNKREIGEVGILSKGEKNHTLYVKVTNASGTSTFALPHEMLQQQPSPITIDRATTHGDDVWIRGCDVPVGWNERRPADRMNRTVDEDYFNWIIDVEDRRMHNTNLREEKDILKPKLVFKTGCFRTNRISDIKYYTVQNGNVADYGYAAAKMEVVIARESTEDIWFEWGRRRVIPSDVTEIELYNVRPEHLNDILAYEMSLRNPMLSKKPVTRAMSNVSMAYEDDFHIYYDDLLHDPSKQERFYFVPDISSLLTRAKLSERSLPFICYSVGGSKR